MPGTIRWMYSGNGLPTTPHVPNDLDGHGTCVATKATGYQFGTAKNANLVVMKLEEGPRAVTISLLRALALVAIDIRDKRLNGMAVVNLSHHLGVLSRRTGNLSPSSLPRSALTKSLHSYTQEVWGNCHSSYETILRT
jgi:hypothetical protein